MRTSKESGRRSSKAVGAAAAVILGLGLSAHGPHGRASAWLSGSPFSAIALRPPTQEKADDGADLAARLRTLCDRAGGEVGVAVIHVETGRVVSVAGARR